mmetsp:Transcript_65436/g.189598  ORF Transcript_65436/g.189598 Transcript_65436/m.189598 type:complete len:273 (+) Transcript_65436:1428-2246(+)
MRCWRHLRLALWELASLASFMTKASDWAAVDPPRARRHGSTVRRHPRRRSVWRAPQPPIGKRSRPASAYSRRWGAPAGPWRPRAPKRRWRRSRLKRAPCQTASCGDQRRTGCLRRRNRRRMRPRRPPPPPAPQPHRRNGAGPRRSSRQPSSEPGRWKRSRHSCKANRRSADRPAARQRAPWLISARALPARSRSSCCCGTCWVPRGRRMARAAPRRRGHCAPTALLCSRGCCQAAPRPPPSSKRKGRIKSAIGLPGRHPRAPRRPPSPRGPG